jgi:hypothetical protein
MVDLLCQTRGRESEREGLGGRWSARGSGTGRGRGRGRGEELALAILTVRKNKQLISVSSSSSLISTISGYIKKIYCLSIKVSRQLRLTVIYSVKKGNFVEVYKSLFE